MQMTDAPFRVAFAPELTPPQYVVTRDALRIVPKPTPMYDPQAESRARTVCAALNRVYGVVQDGARHAEGREA